MKDTEKILTLANKIKTEPTNTSNSQENIENNVIEKEESYTTKPRDIYGNHQINNKSGMLT